MLRAPIVLATIVAIVTGPPAAATDPARPKQLNPTSAWRLDYGKERCALVQQYAGDGDTVLLEIDSYGSREGFQGILSGKGIPFTSGPMRVAVRFPGDPDNRMLRAFAGTTSEHAPAVFLPLSFVPYDEFERRQKVLETGQNGDEEPNKVFSDYQQSVHAFVVGFGRGSVYQVNVGDIAKPLGALRTCVDSLFKSWGVDPVVQDGLSRLAKPEMAGIRGVQAQYPLSMMRELDSTVISVRVIVDANGSATACVLQTPTGDSNVNAELKQSICGSLRHFQPALDANGNPVASAYTTKVTYDVQ